jgi:hypothetical protein
MPVGACVVAGGMGPGGLTGREQAHNTRIAARIVQNFLFMGASDLFTLFVSKFTIFIALYNDVHHLADARAHIISKT